MRLAPFPLDELLQGLPGEDEPVLLEDRGLQLAEALGLEVPEIRVLDPGDGEEAHQLDAALEIPGERVVVKLLTHHVLHRTDLGGVVVVPRTRETLESLLGEWRERFAYADPRFLVAEYLPPEEGAVELLLGFRSTREFGPVVTVAPGGTLAESLAGSLRPEQGPLFLTPGCVARLDEDALAEILARRTFLAPVVSGARGRPPLLGMDATVELVERLALLAAEGDAAGLREFEINPVRVTAGRAVALDALGRVEPLWSRQESAGDPGRTRRRPGALRALLAPDRIAVAGVSAKAMNPGRVILRNVLAAGFPPESLVVVKAGADAVDGVTCVPSVEDLDPPVDLLVLGVPAEQVPAMAEEALSGGRARTLVLISGGLEEGRDLASGTPADRVRASLESVGSTQVAAVGSNCLGVRSVPGRYDTLFIPAWKLGFPDRDPDPVLLLSQSGAFAIARASRAAGLNPRYVVTLGTQLDVTAGEVLEHLLDDDELRSAACYVEGFRPGDGTRFMEAAQAWTRAGRRVILYRGGRSVAGQAAAASHTAALAGEYPVTRSLARLAGVTVCEDLEDFQDQLLLAACLEGRSGGPAVGLLSNAGFECVAMADHAAGLTVATLSEETREALDGVLAKAGLAGIVAPANPLDVTPILGDHGFARAASLLLGDPGVGCGVVSCVPLTPALQTLAADEGHPEDLTAAGGLAPALVELWGKGGKPWVMAVDGGPGYEPLRRYLADAGIPVFPTADRAVRALARWVAAAP